MQLRILLGRQLSSGEYHDGHVRKRSVLADSLKHVEARHVRQAKIEHDAIAGLIAEDSQRLFAGAGADDLDIVVAQQLADTHLLGLVVLDDEQALAAW